MTSPFNLSLQPVHVRLENISKTVQNGQQSLTILDHINLNIPAGKSLSIVGVSGSGKSTLLALIAGLDIPSTGNIFWDDTVISSLDEEARATLRAEKVGFIFQDFELLSHFTAFENVCLPLELFHIPNPEKIAAHWLTRVGLSERFEHLPAFLSGGEQQRVAIARAFAMNPSLLIADEPTGSLDKKNAAHIADLLFELTQENKSTLILATHDDSLVLRCDQRLELSGGLIVS